jgi:outer membrane lipoprotein-sorting protein
MPCPPTKPKPPAAGSRAKFFLAVLGLLVFTAPEALAAETPAPLALTPADRTLLDQIDTYLNRQSAITANFLQVYDNGATRSGKAWLQRPGRMRFEYDPPDKQLLVAGNGLLVYHDPDLNQTTNIPLGSTPLGLLLSQHVDLTSSSIEVTKITRQPGEDDITLVRRDKPAAGTLTLVFSTNPLQLHQWVVVDAQGRQTRVSLYDIAAGGPFPDSLFTYNTGQSPIPSGGGG